MQLRAILVLLVLAAALSRSQSPGLIRLSQIESDPFDWQWKPESALSKCLVSGISIDTSYRLYLCAPDRNYMLPGHRPYVWVRFVPDPTFLPPGYLDPPPAGVAPKQ